MNDSLVYALLVWFWLNFAVNFVCHKMRHCRGRGVGVVGLRKILLTKTERYYSATKLADDSNSTLVRVARLEGVVCLMGRLATPSFLYQQQRLRQRRRWQRRLRRQRLRRRRLRQQRRQQRQRQRRTAQQITAQKKPPINLLPAESDASTAGERVRRLRCQHDQLANRQIAAGVAATHSVGSVCSAAASAPLGAAKETVKIVYFILKKYFLSFKITAFIPYDFLVFL